MVNDIFRATVKQHTIVVHKTPSHIGIPENTVADDVARLLADLPHLAHDQVTEDTIRVWSDSLSVHSPCNKSDQFIWNQGMGRRAKVGFSHPTGHGARSSRSLHRRHLRRSKGNPKAVPARPLRRLHVRRDTTGRVISFDGEQLP